MMNFATLQGLTIPEGVVTQIAKDGVVLWALSGGKIVLEVEKITSDTYAAETTYTGEQFILLYIYPKTNGTVSVTYGGLTKTITDTSGAEEPNAQQVFFGTFYGVSDSVATPASGELTIEGEYYAAGCGKFNVAKSTTKLCNCVTKILSLGASEQIPMSAYGTAALGACTKITTVTIPKSVKMIASPFVGCTGLTEVIFEDIVGWSTYGTEPVPVDVSDPANNAIYMTATGSSYIWVKS